MELCGPMILKSVSEINIHYLFLGANNRINTDWANIRPVGYAGR